MAGPWRPFNRIDRIPEALLNNCSVSASATAPSANRIKPVGGIIVEKLYVVAWRAIVAVTASRAQASALRSIGAWLWYKVAA